MRGRCIQVIVHGGLSDMQLAEARMARSEGVPVVKLYLDQEVKGDDLNLPGLMEGPLKALAAAMKTAPATKARDEAPSGRELPAGLEYVPAEVRVAF